MYLPTRLAYKAGFLINRVNLRNLKKISEHTYKVDENTVITLREGTHDSFIIDEVFNKNSYSKFGFTLKTDDVVVDIGAHIGVFTVFAGKRVPKGKVFGYEPVKDNFDLLKINVFQNKLRNVSIFNKAVTPNGGKVKIHLSSNTGGHSVFPVDTNKALEVESVTLGDIVENNKLKRINFLKMDAEGAEFDIILKSPRKVLKKIDKIIMEYHDYLVSGIDHKNLVYFLTECGFEVSIESSLVNHHIFKLGTLMARKQT